MAAVLPSSTAEHATGDRSEYGSIQFYRMAEVMLRIMVVLPLGLTAVGSAAEAESHAGSLLHPGGFPSKTVPSLQAVAMPTLDPS